MRVFAKLALAAVALAALTTTASAAVIVASPTGGDSPIAPGQTAVWNFEGGAGDDTTHFSFVGGGIFTGTTPGQSATPANDLTHYGAAGFGALNTPAQGSPNAFFLTKPGLQFTSFSAYFGSLDDYNYITFLHNGTQLDILTGTELAFLAGNGASADRSQTGNEANRRFFFTFDASDHVNQIEFSSFAPAFEFDNFAAAITGVPEPQTWAMMILGLGFIGLMLRNGRRQSAIVA